MSPGDPQRNYPAGPLIMAGSPASFAPDLPVMQACPVQHGLPSVAGN